MFNRKINVRFSGVATFLCVGGMLCARIGSAQTCQEAVNGLYAYSAIGIGVPGALISGGASVVSPVFSSTPVGQLLAGANNTGPFSTSGSLTFDGTGGISAKSALQDGTTMTVGSYLVNQDCSISVWLTDAFGTNTTTTALQGVILANGQEIDLGVLQNVSSSSSPNTAVGVIQSNLLIRMVRPLANSCDMTNLNGPYFLVATGTRAATTGTTTGLATEAGFFLFGLAQFDSNGNILAQTASQSPLNYLQLAGSYTIASDCTGTMTLGDGLTSSTSTTVPTVTANFVLTQPAVPSSRATITFSSANGTQTLFGSGQAQQ